MTATTKTTIKTYFQTGDKPTQSQFEDFIDSCAFLAETSSQNFVGGIVVSGGIVGDTSLSTITIASSGAVSRTEKARWGDLPTVKDFGALGDGVTNDTAAFNNALAFGGTVFVPAGTYVITSTININVTGTKLVGVGKASRLNLNSATNGIAFSGGIEDVGLEDLYLFSGSATNTLVRTEGISDKGLFSGIYFEGGGTQLKITSGVASAGSYSINVENCTFYASSVYGLHVAPQALSLAQSIFVRNCGFYGNKASAYFTSGNGFFVSNCRFERQSVISGATAALHFDTCNKASVKDCYFEDNNAINVVEVGSSIKDFTVQDCYFTVNTPAGTLNVVPFICTASNDQIVFDNNYIVAPGITTKMIDFNTSTRVRCHNNILNVTTCTTGITSNCNSNVSDIAFNTFTGTFTTQNTQKTLPYGAKAWINYNGSAAVILDSYNVTSVTKNSAGDYSFNWLNPMQSANYAMVATARQAVNGSSLYAYPTIVSQTVSAGRIQMWPSGSGLGSFPDTKIINVIVMGA